MSRERQQKNRPLRGGRFQVAKAAQRPPCRRGRSRVPRASTWRRGPARKGRRLVSRHGPARRRALGQTGGVGGRGRTVTGVEQPPSAARRLDQRRVLDDAALPGLVGGEQAVGGAGHSSPSPVRSCTQILTGSPQQLPSAFQTRCRPPRPSRVHARVDRPAEAPLADERRAQGVAVRARPRCWRRRGDALPAAGRSCTLTYSR